MNTDDNSTPLSPEQLNHVSDIVDQYCTPELDFNTDCDCKEGDCECCISLPGIWDMNFSNKIDVPIVNSSSNPLPTYATDGSSGADVYSNIDAIIQAGETMMIPTGLKMAVPFGYECQVRPRSGLAFKYQVSVINTPGTIDSDYRGEVCVLLVNHGKESFYVNKGDRIAQLVLTPVYQFQFDLVEELPSTERAEGGFGSTGVQ